MCISSGYRDYLMAFALPCGSVRSGTVARTEKNWSRAHGVACRFWLRGCRSTKNEEIIWSDWLSEILVFYSQPPENKQSR